MLHSQGSQLKSNAEERHNSLLKEASQEMPRVGVEDTADKVESIGCSQRDDDVLQAEGGGSAPIRFVVSRFPASSRLRGDAIAVS